MMILFSIVIALILERVLPQLVELRRFNWLSEYTLWLADILNFQRIGAWLASGIVLFPIILLIWILSGMFENALFGLFELAFNVAVIFSALDHVSWILRWISIWMRSMSVMPSNVSAVHLV